ncbi:MAG: zinc-binding dehydrogenase [Acidimicrobiales bacterium]
MFTGEVGRATRWPCSVAAGWATRPSPGRAWRVRRRSSPWTSTREAGAGHAVRRHHTVGASSVGAVAAVQELTDGNGADVCIEAVGNPKVLEQCFYARDLAGTVVQVGVPDPDMRIDLPMIDFFGRGGALKPSWYGDCLPSRDFPMLIDLYLQGRLDLDRFISETISLDQVEEAFHRMERGEVLRSVVVLGDGAAG